ncbi:MAG: hypothetical protein HYX96_04565 [Chloroflexi bacterium]|nr:hypothetical protein [Chloroflexota bacterium]
MPENCHEAMLRELLVNHVRDECGRELLLFLGRHPYARLSKRALAYALNWRKSDIDKTLYDFLKNNLVKTHSENGISFYRLTDDEPMNSLARCLAGLTWSQWQELVRNNSEPARAPSPAITFKQLLMPDIRV